MRTKSNAALRAAQHARARGFTLVETTIAASVLTIVSLGAVVFFRGTMSSMDESAHEARSRNAGLASLAQLERDFAHSTPERIEIQARSSYEDEVRLQITIGLDTTGPIWGAISMRPISIDDEERSRHPGWRIRYHVEGTQLLRDLVDEEGVPVPDTAIVVARDLVPESAAGGQYGRTVDLDIFRVWQPEPQTAERIFAAVLSTAAPKVDERGQTKLGPIKLHRTTLRAGRE